MIDMDYIGLPKILQAAGQMDCQDILVQLTTNSLIFAYHPLPQYFATSTSSVVQKMLFLFSPPTCCSD